MNFNLQFSEYLPDRQDKQLIYKIFQCEDLSRSRMYDLWNNPLKYFLVIEILNYSIHAYLVQDM